MKTYTVISYNFAVPQDISILQSFTSLQKAFEIALRDVVSVQGQKITLHNAPETIQGDYTRVETRLSNGNSLGSSYGISYSSYYGSYPCSRIIAEREIVE